jgi:hypothetical protein
MMYVKLKTLARAMLAALGAGVWLGVLNAPASGDRTRRRLRRKRREIGRQTAETLGSAGELVRSVRHPLD